MFCSGDPLMEDDFLIEGLNPNQELHHVIMKGIMGIRCCPLFLILVSH